MKGFKDPGFQDRAAASAQAKQSALEKMKAVPQRDPAEVAARLARQQEREARDAAKREAARVAREAAQAAKAEKAAQEAAAAEAAKPKVRTEAELKAARDARYAARKKRKS